MTDNTISYFAIQFTETVEVRWHDHDDNPVTFTRGEWLAQSTIKSSTKNKRSIKIFKQIKNAKKDLAQLNSRVWYDNIQNAGNPQIIELTLTFPTL